MNYRVRTIYFIYMSETQNYFLDDRHWQPSTALALHLLDGLKRQARADWIAKRLWDYV